MRLDIVLRRVSKRWSVCTWHRDSVPHPDTNLRDLVRCIMTQSLFSVHHCALAYILRIWRTITCVVYRALITNGNDGSTATYTGLTEPPFKKRVAGHKSDIKNHNPGSDEHKAGTRLSRHCGGMKLKGIPYTIEWSILKRTYGAFNPHRNFCQLSV